MICDKVNATIFKKHNVNAAGVTVTSETSEQQLSELNNLSLGQEILIKIKNIKYDKKDLFIVADFAGHVTDEVKTNGHVSE